MKVDVAFDYADEDNAMGLGEANDTLTTILGRSCAAGNAADI